MASCWEGFKVVPNVLALHVVFLLFTSQLSPRIWAAHAVLHLVGGFLAVQASPSGMGAFWSSELVAVQVVMLVVHLKFLRDFLSTLAPPPASHKSVTVPHVAVVLGAAVAGGATWMLSSGAPPCGPGAWLVGLAGP
eukprot:CAMPEP_0113688256 /NCGR_PEP_ID=MMETSP0038_2-20120614/16418_1 /TAXON_ID=2898 /ORGANISM="Cryptomonas paramecium" /LENGTH=135 /DNA_ID=CAMNT_0000609017 /DNA_START=573 /DNA_END=976 /DNA_ORIENTATION=+ /assembly_acc=CAM_ASM_000170